MRPIKPKQWSPCRWEMNTWFSRENLSRERLIWSWAPSPQSIIYNFSRMLMTCEVAKCRVVGSADPHPNIVSSNFSMPFGYELRCTKIHKKRVRSSSLPTLLFLFSKHLQRNIFHECFHCFVRCQTEIVIQCGGTTVTVFTALPEQTFVVAQEWCTFHLRLVLQD